MRRTRRALKTLVICACPLFTPGVAHADVVLRWNVLALETTAAAPFNPPMESRNLAIVHAAIFDAVNAIVREFRPYAIRLDPPAGASPEAAAIAAAHCALVQLYPDQRTALDAAYATSLAAIPDGPARRDGIVIGETAATKILALRAADGAVAAVTADYTPGVGAGAWVPTPPPSLPALDPGWAAVRPFLIEDPWQFRPGMPPALHSRRYTLDFDEVKEIGAAASKSRTQEQTDVARFWIATGPQNWNPAARQAAAARGLTLVETARLFALLNLAGADAFIASWDAKFAYNQWRPVTAIRAAAGDGNPDTVADPTWTPLLVTPPFPDYIAGHTAYAGAAENVLEHVFGKRPGFVLTITSASAPGVTQTFATFEAMADCVVDARVWGGIHWRTSSARGLAVGHEIGRFAVHNFLKPMRGRSNLR